jgi:hypothetical protein
LLFVKLLTSDEFAHWFASRDDRTAEDVAAMLEVISQLGTEREAPGSSDWLTWYEHPSIGDRFRALDMHSLYDPSVARFLDEWRVFQGYVKRVVKHLESTQFLARLGQLDSRDAARVSEAVARIKKAGTRRHLAMTEYMLKQRLGRRPLTPVQSVDLGRFLDEREIREAYLAALDAAGFAVVDLPNDSPALREISLRTSAPGFRLLYGLDARRKLGLVVLGETFERSFYGDSVRRAERVWLEFLNGEQPAVQPG